MGWLPFTTIKKNKKIYKFTNEYWLSKMKLKQGREGTTAMKLISIQVYNLEF